MREERAIFLYALPVNPKPFVRRLGELLDEGQTILDDDVRAVLWIINMMAFGQIATISMTEEYRRLLTSIAADV